MPRRPPRRERIRSNRERIDADFPGLLAVLEVPDEKRGVLWWEDLDDQLADLVWPRWRSPVPGTKQRAQGCYFDVAEVQRFLRFGALLRHIKGRRFARRPFIPDLWQVVHFIAPVFGWKNPDGTRIYLEAFLEVARKNGKSTLVAAIGLYLLVADGEPGAEIYSVAKDRDQARAVWAVGAQMARAAPALRRLLRIPPHPEQRGDKISYDRTSSVWTVLGKDRQGAKHHGLNIHAYLIDELHTIIDAEQIGTIETGTGSREQPLGVTITTAGIESESPVWIIKREFAIKVANRVIEAPRSWCVIFAADPKVATNGRWQRKEVWRDANPGYGRSVRPQYLAQMAEKAKSNAVDRDRFLRLHLGVPTESSVGFIELPTWDRTAGLVAADELEGADCYGGLDLSDSLDLCAFTLLFPPRAGATDGICDVLAWFWTPAATLHARAMRDRANYVQWAADGWLITTPGEVVDYDIVEDQLIALNSRFNIIGTNYDRWGAKQLRDHLADGGMEIWEMGQGYQSMSPPLKLLQRIVTDRKLRHGGNPVLRYCCSGMKVAIDPAGNVKPDRKRSTSRIDGMAALTMSVDAWDRAPEGGRSVYEERGLEVAG